MDKAFDRRTAIKLAAGACLAGPLAGAARAQPQPAPPKPGNLPPVVPVPPAAAQPTNTAVPNSASYPTQIGGRQLEDWIRDIDDTDPSVRARAIQVVIDFGPSARKAIPAVTRQVKQLNDLSPQAYAIIALAELVPLTPPPPPGGTPDKWTTDAVNAVISVLNSPQAVIRFRAATTLGYIGMQARGAVQELMRWVNDRQSWEIRKAVCFALGTAGRDEQGYPIPSALEALANGVSDPVSKDVRLEALQSVIRLGPPSPPVALPRLGNALQQRLKVERDKIVQLWVRVAVMAQDAKQISDKNVDAIGIEMKSTDPELRVAAVRAVGVMGPAAKRLVQDLIDALPRSADPVLSVELCRALGRMGQHAERAIPVLETAQLQKEDAVKVAAAAAVADIKRAVDFAKQQPARLPGK
jgi:HEAT repeat protein